VVIAAGLTLVASPLESSSAIDSGSAVNVIRCVKSTTRREQKSASRGFRRASRAGHARRRVGLRRQPSQLAMMEGVL
jgi:hypothetical protein